MIVFHNHGVVPIAAFTTFGMSAKPGSTNPIGKFGTGLKNAVAICLRLGGTFKLFRGQEEYEFYTKDEDFRGQTFARVRMKRRRGILARWSYEEMPFTTELGKHWKPWMAVRELEANVRDEDGWSFTCDEEYYQNHVIGDFIKDERTVIVVECEAMEEAYKDLGSIFLPPERQKLYEDASVAIYEGESEYLFYRGMRVTDLRKPSLYTYEMKSIQLTEDRTSMYSFLDASTIKKALLACPVDTIVRKVVRNSEDRYEGTFDWDDKKPTVSHSWSGALGYSGISSRFKTLRENLHYGISKAEDISIELTLESWIRVLEVLENVGDAAAPAVREQMIEAGWKPDVEKPSEEDEEPEEDPEAFKQASSVSTDPDDGVPF